MNRGDVVFWKKYPFPDRGAPQGLAPSDKLFVVIGVDSDDGVLLFRATSQPRNDRPDEDGCHADFSVFRFNRHLARFRMPTWVQFEGFSIHEVREIKNAGAYVNFSLDHNDIQAIINCFKKSPELANWVLPYCK